MVVDVEIIDIIKSASSKRVVKITAVNEASAFPGGMQCKWYGCSSYISFVEYRVELLTLVTSHRNFKLSAMLLVALENTNSLTLFIHKLCQRLQSFIN